MKYAVLTNDLQQGIVHKHAKRTQQVASFLPTLISFFDRMRTIDVPIFHLQLVIAEDDPRAQGVEFDYPAMTEGAPGAAMLPEVLDEKDFVIVKNKDSGFFQTQLNDSLRQEGVEGVIVCGLQTHICVQTTAVDAFFRGYKIVVPKDGVFSPREEDTIKALAWLEWYCATISTMDEIHHCLTTDTQFPPRP